MKPVFFILLLLCSYAANAQKLNLKKGQKFSYEYLTESGQEVSYSKIDFEVIQKQKDQYRLKVLIGRTVASSSTFPGRFYDTGFGVLPLENDPSAAMASALSSTPFYMVITHTGRVVAIEDLDSVKATVAKKIDGFLEFRISRQSPRSFLDAVFSGFLMNRGRAIFGKPGLGNDAPVSMDTVYVQNSTRNSYKMVGQKMETTRHPSIDTIRLRQFAKSDKQSGLLQSLTRDSSSRSIQLDDRTHHIATGFLGVSRIQEGKKGANPESPLYTRLKKSVNYDRYFSPTQADIRIISRMRDYGRTNRGKLGVEKRMAALLDSLDKRRPVTDHPADDDYSYQAARVDILTTTDWKASLEVIRQVPVEYLSSEAHVAYKAEIYYRAGDAAGYAQCLKLFFTKFNQPDGLPLNMHLVANFIHHEIALDVVNTREPLVLNRVNACIMEAEKLNIPVLTGMFGGIKTLVKAKLAGDHSQLEEVTTTDFAGAFDKPGRYRLLVYDELTFKKVPDSVRSAYLDYTIEHIEKKLNQLGTAPARTYEEEQRPMMRKYLADAYYRKSVFDKKSALLFLNLASEYAPSQKDRLDDAGYLQMEYKIIPYIDYTKLYLDRAGVTENSSDGYLKKYLELVIVQPERYKDLKEMYAKRFPSGNFKAFFSNTLKDKLPKTPAFLLAETSGKKISSAGYANQFVFIDFWGTWCRPCINEIHKIDELHKMNTDPRLAVTTIACFDKKEDVTAFMKDRGFTYQALLSDGKVQDDFEVQSYPTKLLLLPNGTHLVIPFRDDYKTLLDKYLLWEL